MIRLHIVKGSNPDQVAKEVELIVGQLSPNEIVSINFAKKDDQGYGGDLHRAYIYYSTDKELVFG